MNQRRSWPADLVGLLWAEAEPLLQDRGLSYESVITGPPNRPVGIGPLRVIAEQESAGRRLMILAHRDYRRADVSDTDS